MRNQMAADRLRKMLAVAVVIVLVLMGRMAWLQLYKGMYYGAQADGNRMRSNLVMAPRGLIYDCNGQILADNFSGYRVGIQPLRKPDDAEISLLSRILAIPEDKIRAKIKKAGNSYETAYLKSDLSPAEITALEENYRDLPGVSLDLQPIRRYPYKELAAHVLGYVGEVSGAQQAEGRYKGLPSGSIVGKDGLEWIYDKLLRGTDGRRTEEVDVRGRIVRELAGQSPTVGKNLVLTIDLRMQKVMEKAVDEQLQFLRSSGWAPNAFSCAVVAMDPRTGAIKAMVSRPAFDPNWFVNGISTTNWNKINNNTFHPLTNKVISGLYPPGSTFKIVTGAAALDLHKVTPEEKIFDSGKYWMADIGNAGGEALGWINFETALAKSDNVYFYEMGYRVGIDNLDDYSRKFGFGKKTGIKLPGEAEGILSSPEVKKQIYDEPWRLGDTFNAAIGQGFTLATPLQLAQMLSTVAENGVLHPPYLVEKVVNEDGSTYMVPEKPKAIDLGISKETLQLVRQGLASVAQEGGTASYLASLPAPAAGKTGTSENPHGRDHGLFIAYTPADDPSLVIACVVEQGSYGSVSAVPIVYKVMDAYLKNYPEPDKKEAAGTN